MKNKYNFECIVDYNDDTQDVWLADTYENAIAQVKCQLNDPQAVIGFVKKLTNNIPVHTWSVTK